MSGFFLCKRIPLLTDALWRVGKKAAADFSQLKVLREWCEVCFAQRLLQRLLLAAHYRPRLRSLRRSAQGLRGRSFFKRGSRRGHLSHSCRLKENPAVFSRFEGNCRSPLENALGDAMRRVCLHSIQQHNSTTARGASFVNAARPVSVSSAKATLANTAVLRWLQGGGKGGVHAVCAIGCRDEAIWQMAQANGREGLVALKAQRRDGKRKDDAAWQEAKSWERGGQ